MKKAIAILILSCLLFSCRQNYSEKKQIAIDKPIQHFTPFLMVDNKLIEYDIDTLKSFKKVTDIIYNIDCSKEYALFKLETDKKIYKIQPLQVCNYIFDYKLRGVIYINTDSITVNYELILPIDSLKVTLKNHLLNPNNDENFPSKDKHKLISINVDSKKDIAETEKLLLKIIEEINELDNKPNFSFMFENRGIIPKPIYE